MKITFYMNMSGTYSIYAMQVSEEYAIKLSKAFKKVKAPITITKQMGEGYYLHNSYSYTKETVEAIKAELKKEVQ